LIGLEQYSPISENDFPAAFQAADGGAIRARRNYLWASRTDLILILLGTVSTSWAIESTSGRAFLAIVGAISLGLGLLATLFIKISDSEKTWFGYRAIAESLKTMTWRYITKTTPYDNALSAKEVDDLFTTQFGQILQMPRNQQVTLAGDEGSGEQITKPMREVRDLDIKIRKALYVRDRIKDQQIWYTNNAKENAQKGSQMLIAVILCQAVAMGAAILLVRWPDFNFNFASILSAGAATLLAWLQLKRHQELAFAYGQAAHDLGLIVARERHITNDEELSLFVSDAENAISREHTMWLARRDYI